MPELNEQEKPATEESLRSFLFNEERNFLIRNNGEKVSVEEVGGKHVGLYFADQFYASRDFTTVLSEIYKQLSEKGDFEIVFIFPEFDEVFDVTEDTYRKAFEESHHTMPWLALPFSDENSRKKLKKAFQVNQIPSLVILDKDGKTITPYGVELFEEFGVEGYPFTAEKIDEARAKVKAFRDAQTLESLLVSDERDFVIGHGEKKVPVADLLGKTVVLYFSTKASPDSYEFTRYLSRFYNELRERGEAIEIVFLSDDQEETDFQKHYETMPWLALPFGDKTTKKLFRYFRLPFTPNVAIVHPDGKSHWEMPESGYFYIMNSGTRYYPFTKERLDEIEAEEAKAKAKRESQTLESILVSDERDFVINHEGVHIPVAELVGKTVGLYFCTRSHSCCLTEVIVRIYNEIREKGGVFEIVLISGDEDQETFEDHYRSMPWLALPFGDKRHAEEIFGHRDVSLVVIGPEGRTVRDDAHRTIGTYGARAYPFTQAHLERMVEELAKESPKKIICTMHECPVKLTQAPEFSCDYCYQDGFGWCYRCCCYGWEMDLHLTCALENQSPWEHVDDLDNETNTESETDWDDWDNETNTETETETETEEEVDEDNGQDTGGEIGTA